MTSGPYPTLSRTAGDGKSAAPVSHVHLGLGSFFRAHLAFYSEHAPDRDQWGIAAFTGRSSALAETLARQDNLYTLITRAASEDQFDVLSSLTATHPAADHERLLHYFASPEVRLLSLTVTEAGYHRDATGALDLEHPDIQGDIAALRADPNAAVTSIPARLAACCQTRRAASLGPLTILSCDNLPGNGNATAAVTTQFAALLDPALATWIAEYASFPNTVVDRITPRLSPTDSGDVARQTGRLDHAPVVTEPFTEWIISGAFPAGRPTWEVAGARFASDIEPFEHRKLWLLNGAHSLLAYTATLRGHATVADAISDPVCQGWVEQWWDEASPHLPLPPPDTDAYRAALLERFANARIRHQLSQIASDGSLKLPIRILPVLHAERALTRLPVGAIRILAGWLCHLRGAGAPLNDPAAQQLTALAAGSLKAAAGRVLGFLDSGLADDDDLVAATVQAAREIVT